MFKRTIALLFLVLASCLAGCGDTQLGGFSPAAPASLNATSGADRIDLTWIPSESTTPSQGATFNVYRGTMASGALAGKTRIADGLAAAAYADSSAGIGTRYYQVTATIYGLESGPSNEIGIARQGSSSLLLAGGSASAVNNLSWGGVQGATGYTLYRGMTASGSLADKIPWRSIVAGSGVTSFTDTTVAVGLTYYYQVVALYASGESLLSNEVAVTTR